MKRFVALLACMAVAGCTHTKVKSAAPAMLVQPAAESRGLLVQPDVQLSMLTASGLEAVRKDWSTAAEANLTTAIVEDLKGRSHAFELLDPQTSMQGRIGQLLRLHEAVGDSVQFFEYGDSKLPTKKKKFDWTLGEGTQLLRREKGADYALFVTGRGSYATTERKILSVGALLLLQNVPLGKQRVMASLVDLRTGRVVWFNVTTAGPGTDVRTPEGARDLSHSLLKDIPL